MIVPTGQLIRFIDRFGSNSVIAKNIGIDEATLSKLYNRKMGASATVIESILRFTDWPFESAFAIVSDEDQ